MTPIRNYRDLIVWQKSVKLVTDIYDITKAFPKDELFGLTSQIRRSAISIPSNIAEGYGRNSTGDYKRFLQIAVGSLYEMQTQLEIAYNLEYIAKDVFDEKFEKCIEIDKMSYSLIQKIK
jgi:four helix bundle protein